MKLFYISRLTKETSHLVKSLRNAANINSNKLRKSCGIRNKNCGTLLSMFGYKLVVDYSIQRHESNLDNNIRV